MVEGHRWLERAVGGAELTDPRVRGASHLAAWVSLEAGDAETAALHAAEAVELNEQTGDHTSLGMAWTVSAAGAPEGRIDLAVTCLERGQAADEAAGDQWHKGLAAPLRMWAASLRGERDVAEREALSAISSFRSVGDICTLVERSTSTATCSSSPASPTRPKRRLAQARDVSEAFGLRGWLSTMRAGWAGVPSSGRRRASDRALPDSRRSRPRAGAANGRGRRPRGAGLRPRTRGDQDAARLCREEARAVEPAPGRATVANCERSGICVTFSAVDRGNCDANRGAAAELAQHIHPSGIQHWLRPMQPRDPDEDERAPTPLELFFDLVFVVAVAQAANSLHHVMSEGGSVGARRQVHPGVLRHLVGLDELLLVRLGLRHRGYRLPADRLRPDDRCTDLRRWHPRAFERARLQRSRHRLCRHASGPGVPLAAGRGRRPAARTCRRTPSGSPSARSAGSPSSSCRMGGRRLHLPRHS